MTAPYLGEIRLMSFDFAPKNWAACNGQLLAINSNQALFSLLGTMYGGNGQTNFALPDLRGRMPLHFGNGFALGQLAGEESTTLTTASLPTHSHAVIAAPTATGTTPTGGYLAAPPKPAFTTTDPSVAMDPAAVGPSGESQPHNNMPPYLGLTFAIALVGIFTSRP